MLRISFAVDCFTLLHQRIFFLTLLGSLLRIVLGTKGPRFLHFINSSCHESLLNMLLHSHAPHSPLNMSRVHIACFLLPSCSDLPFACFDIYSMPKSNWLLGVNLQQNFQRCGRVDGEKEERRNTLLHHIVYNNVPHHFCTPKRVALGGFLVSST